MQKESLKRIVRTGCVWQGRQHTEKSGGKRNSRFIPGTIENLNELEPSTKLFKDIAEIIYFGQDNRQAQANTKTDIEFHYVARFSYF